MELEQCLMWVAEISIRTVLSLLDETLAYLGFHWAAVSMLHGVPLVSVYSTCEW